MNPQKQSSIDETLTIREASEWASNYINMNITKENISYLIQYGKLPKIKEDSSVKVKKDELKQYYDEKYIQKQKEWEDRLGEKLNWSLSFEELREKERTKHVHRLHSYKGKFIPQLVEYFLDTHINEFKGKVYFRKGDTVLDPFMGSGTTLVQSGELGLNSIGVDVSEFNCLISKVKIEKYDMHDLYIILKKALQQTIAFSAENFDDNYIDSLKDFISKFNDEYFPSPEFKRKIYNNQIDEKEYINEKMKIFRQEYSDFKKEYRENPNKKSNQRTLNFERNSKKADLKSLEEEIEDKDFIVKWYPDRIRKEIGFYRKRIEEVNSEKIRNVMKIVLSRTARSCRATPHYSLAHLEEPVFEPYYCYKHKKICFPTNSIIHSTSSHLKRYTYDTIERIREYKELRDLNVEQMVLVGDSRKIELFEETKKTNSDFGQKLEDKRIDGIFTSPPYVGQIDYHEQHAYAYELFDLERRDDKEIGPKKKGKSEDAKADYVKGISSVFRHMNKFLKKDAHIFIVANDKYNLYKEIAELSGLEIKKRFQRPVLNRTSRDRNPYSETIFYMQKK
jgi:hypothetical protein